MKNSSEGARDARALWEEFCSSRNERLRSVLIERYMPLAKIIAAKMYGLRSDRSLRFDDYLQYARVGLVESVDRYDWTRSASFESYSTHRIRGAILNGVGRESEAAAQRSFWRTRMPDRLESVAADIINHPPRASLEGLIDLTIGIALGLVLEEDDATDPIDETPQANPYAAIEFDQFVRLTKSMLEKLPDREREIVKGHYFDHLEFQEIAQRYSITKGRVSQLHGKAIERLRQLLADRPRLNKRL